ncbi:MAG TPA: transcription antitermination factor NusB [Candidatus Lumbricidophila sp.]|nr:transcription antitermination factor NusB [Candidatus Lumbricidophila sp.]
MASTDRPGRLRSPRSRDEPATARVSPARIVAWEVLQAVRVDGAYANLLLPNRITRSRLSEADAALATELTYGTLRWQGYYDAIIELVADRAVSSIDPDVLDVLRLGAHQLLATRVATHAAVFEQAQIARRVAPGAVGFVNGVLRTISRSSADEWRGWVAEHAASEQIARAALSSHPTWIIDALGSALAHEGRADELDALLLADNDPPKVNLAVLPLPDADSPASIGEPNQFSPLGATADRPLAVVAEHEGRVRVQDEGSQLAALSLSRARPVAPGETWLDLCAAPGGKTAILAAEALATGARLVANELVPARADLVRSSIASVPLEVAVRVGDGRTLDAAEFGASAGFDRVLLDAPCTGLGALRRRPESRWRKSPTDVAELTALQSELFDAAVRVLAPGGILAYVTCSPHLPETRQLVDAALARHPELTRLDTQSVVQSVALAPLDLAGEATAVQLWPHRHRTDAMFIALFARA